ncbi:hypothetical protein ACLOJK_033245 [Asimina triloba]
MSPFTQKNRYGSSPFNTSDAVANAATHSTTTSNGNGIPDDISPRPERKTNKQDRVGRNEGKERKGRNGGEPNAPQIPNPISLRHPKILVFPSNYMTAATAHLPSHVACVNKTICFHFRNEDLDSARQLGKLEEALQLFQQIPQPDVYSYDIMLSCYFQNSDIVVRTITGQYQNSEFS